MFKKQFFSRFMLTMAVIFLPVIGHAYVIYNKTSEKLAVVDENTMGGLAKIIPAGQSTACRPSNFSCSDYKNFFVTLHGYHGKYLCSYRIYLKKGETGHYFLIKQVGPDNDIKKTLV